MRYEKLALSPAYRQPRGTRWILNKPSNRDEQQREDEENPTWLSTDKSINCSSTFQTANHSGRKTKKYFNEKIFNCTNSKALFSVASEMKGITNRNPLPSNTPTKGLPDVFGELFHTQVSEIKESFINDIDSFSHILNEVYLFEN